MVAWTPAKRAAKAANDKISKPKDFMEGEDLRPMSVLLERDTRTDFRPRGGLFFGAAGSDLPSLFFGHPFLLSIPVLRDIDASSRRTKDFYTVFCRTEIEGSQMKGEASAGKLELHQGCRGLAISLFPSQLLRWLQTRSLKLPHSTRIDRKVILPSLR